MPQFLLIQMTDDTDAHIEKTADSKKAIREILSNISTRQYREEDGIIDRARLFLDLYQPTNQEPTVTQFSEHGNQLFIELHRQRHNIITGVIKNYKTNTHYYIKIKK